MQLEVTARRFGLARNSGRTWPRLAVSSRVRAQTAMAAAGGIAFGIYLMTLAPSVMWYDMGEFATASATLGIAHNTGYPLLILLGKAFTFLPVGDTAYRVNLMSAVFTALAVALVFGIIHDLTDDFIASALGALTLAFASTVWANATWATSYGLNLFFTALITRLMFAWWRTRSPGTLAAAALAFGLGLCNHRLIVLVAPPSLLLLALGWRSLDRRGVAVAALAFLAGLAVYAYLPIRGEQEPALSWARPANWHTYWSMFLNGQTPAGYWRFELRDRISVLWQYPAYDLTWAGLTLAGVGAAVLAQRQRAVAAYFLLLVALDALVVETYSIHNIYNYLTPGYLALCVLIGVAAAWMIGVVRRAALAQDAVRPALRVAALALVLALLPAALIARNYNRVDRGNDYSALDFAQAALDHLPPNAVVLTDTWTASPLWYLQLVQGQRPDVGISPIFSVTDEDAGAFAKQQMDRGRPVYVAEGLRTPLAGLAKQYSLQPVLLDAIEQMVVNELPRPQYRDDLVTTGSLYRLLEKAPDPRVAAVPPDARRDARFSAGVSLAGFATDGQIVERGGVLRLTYYWRADQALAGDLSAVTLFFDQDGRAASRRGFPVWSQKRLIGQGALQTSQWGAGALVRESYFVLAPRTVAPGDYDVRIAVYDAQAAPGRTRSDARELVSIGRFTLK